MYADQHPSIPQKLLNLTLHALGVLTAGWLLWGGGMAGMQSTLNLSLAEAEPSRRALLLICSIVLFARACLAMMVFMKRRLGWAESASVGVMLMIIHPLLAIIGGSWPAQLDGYDGIAITLYVAGSLMNTLSEWQRYHFKKDPAKRNVLYTGGLFSISIHVNFLGDVVLFTGFAMLTGSVAMLALPVALAFNFVFNIIPKLDEHLVERYGVAYRTWRRDHFRFIPLVY